MKEIWKDIKGYEGYYQVSNFGRVKRLARKTTRNNGKSENANYTLKERIKKPQIQTQGYLHVVLYKDGFCKTCRLNRLVAEAFVENPESKKEVNHKDGNKLNNNADNLEWVTSSENIRHAYKKGIIKHYTRKVVQLSEDGTVLNKFDSLKDAADFVNGTKSGICLACKSVKSKYYGFFWRYDD